MPRKFALKFAEGAPVDESFLQFADELFSELGLSAELAQRAADRWQTYAGQRVATGAADAQRQADALKTTWGKDWDTHVAAGQKAVKALGMSAKDLDALEGAAGLGPVMSLFARLGRNVTNSGAPGESKISVPSPEAALERIEEMKADKDFQTLLRSPREPGHAKAVREWELAFAAAHPAPEAAPATPVPAPARAASTSTPARRDAALARISALSIDENFQSRMRTPGPNRESAVREWNVLHQDAYAPEGSAS